MNTNTLLIVFSRLGSTNYENGYLLHNILYYEYNKENKTIVIRYTDYKTTVVKNVINILIQ